MSRTAIEQNSKMKARRIHRTHRKLADPGIQALPVTVLVSLGIILRMLLGAVLAVLVLRNGILASGSGDAHGGEIKLSALAITRLNYSLTFYDFGDLG